jgi:hypothetical protein
MGAVVATAFGDQKITVEADLGTCAARWRRSTEKGGDMPKRGRSSRKTGRRTRNRVEGGIRNFTLTRAGSSITLEIFSGRTPLGTADIGVGSIMWRGPYGKKPKRIRWQRFAEWIRRGASLS